MMMKIHLVTGATGFLGRHLVKVLLESGDTVWIVVRADQKTTANERASTLFAGFKQKYGTSFHVISGDILQDRLGISKSDTDQLRKAHTIVWHLAANLSFLPKNRKAVYDTNYRGTVNIVDYANKYANEFFYVSTAYICGDAIQLDENDLGENQHFNNEYERSKHQAERYVRERCALPYLVFRPSIIIGDAHKGKAEGCTFGYYRYLYVFHFLKTQISRAVEQRTIMGGILRTLGITHTDNTITTKNLVLPYPKSATVDLVPVDFVVESMQKLALSDVRNTGAYLTQSTPPTFQFLFKAALADLGYREVKFLATPSWLFRLILRLLYILSFSYRKYIRSVMWYTPYITKTTKFTNKSAAVTSVIGQAPPITRDRIKKINLHARDDLLADLEI